MDNNCADGNSLGSRNSNSSVGSRSRDGIVVVVMVVEVKVSYIATVALAQLYVYSQLAEVKSLHIVNMYCA